MLRRSRTLGRMRTVLSSIFERNSAKNGRHVVLVAIDAMTNRLMHQVSLSRAPQSRTPLSHVLGRVYQSRLTSGFLTSYANLVNHCSLAILFAIVIAILSPSQWPPPPANVLSTP